MPVSFDVGKWIPEQEPSVVVDKIPLDPPVRSTFIKSARKEF